ncbi:MAG TPA: acyl carrier protein [Candidatus Wallbacteria bacterium]|nr:acyl carrier protein [Candidatus Wallbacteria bacterium]
MTYESVYEKVVKIAVEELDVEESKITKESNFQEDLNADSLALVEIIMKFEEEFEIEIPDDQSEKIRTVDQAVKYILEKKA